MKKVLACLAPMLVAGCALSTGPAHPLPSPLPSASVPAKPAKPDATKDVTIVSVHSSHGVATVRFQVKNHSHTTSDYNVYLVAENKSGSLQYDAASTYLAHIRPKQKRFNEVLLNRVPKSVKVSIVNVERWDS